MVTVFFSVTSVGVLKWHVLLELIFGIVLASILSQKQNTAVCHDPSIYKVQISNACSFSVAFNFTTCGTYFRIYSVLICVHMKKVGGFWSTVVVCLFVTLFLLFSVIYLKHVIT